MRIDLAAARDFMTTHARLLDRRRFDLLIGEGTADGVAGALEAYRNADGGYAWGLEPDLRATESQPAGALHAFEAFAEVIEVHPSPRPAELCDWLAEVSLAEGGLPFARPIGNAAGCSPFWGQADPTVASLQITAAVVAKAHMVAGHDDAVARHPWLGTATQYCLDAIDGIGDAPHAYALSFALQLLDTVADRSDRARALLDRLAPLLPEDGVLQVEGGTADERLRPLDYAPVPDRPVRAILAPAAITADLARLAGEQQPDGGWTVDFATSSPAAALEWRGYVTHGAVAILQRAAADGST